MLPRQFFLCLISASRSYHGVIETNLLRIMNLPIDDSLKPADCFPNLKAIVDIQMKRMFPKQHGLQNVFSPSMPSTGWLPDARQAMGTFKYRTERAKRKAAGGWRLRSMKTLVEEMLVLNQKCRFMALLQHYCPVAVCYLIRSNFSLWRYLLSSACSLIQTTD